MDILLVNPPTLYRRETVNGLDAINLNSPVMPYYERLLLSDLSKRNGPSTFPGEHLGLQSLQASLEAAGHTVTVLNACIELHSTLSQTLARIKEYPFDLVGFTGPLDVFAENLWLARTLREDGYTGHITLGHDFVTLNHEIILSLYPVFDSVVRGEGEVTIVELAGALEHRQSLHNVPGITFRDHVGITVNPSRQVISDLDQLPWIARHDIRKVINLNMSVGIFTRRGCPYECGFCTTGAVTLSEGFYGRNRWRKRSAKRVVDEIEFLVNEYGIQWFTIVDDLYISKGRVGSSHALEVAEEILMRELDINYMIDCRVDSIDFGIFSILRRSGLRKVFVGVESGSDIVLASYKKGYKSEGIRKKLNILDELEIEFILGYIMFNPLDTLEGLEQSYQLILDLNRRDFALFLQSVRIYPGTPLHRDLEQRKLLLGKFPNFSAKYVNPHVSHIRKMMSELESLVVPVLRASSVESYEAGETYEQLYALFSYAFGEFIQHCKRDDTQGMEIVHQEVMYRLAHLVHRTRN